MRMTWRHIRLMAVVYFVLAVILVVLSGFLPRAAGHLSLVTGFVMLLTGQLALWVSKAVRHLVERIAKLEGDRKQTEDRESPPET